jgi:hypothetical protein
LVLNPRFVVLSTWNFPAGLHSSIQDFWVALDIGSVPPLLQPSQYFIYLGIVSVYLRNLRSTHVLSQASRS